MCAGVSGRGFRRAEVLGRAAERAVRMVRDRKVVARDGSSIPIQADTICIHGDTPDAAGLAAAVKLGLEHAGITVAGLTQ